MENFIYSFPHSVIHSQKWANRYVWNVIMSQVWALAVLNCTDESQGDVFCKKTWHVWKKTDVKLEILNSSSSFPC